MAFLLEPPLGLMMPTIPEPESVGVRSLGAAFRFD
jgi:hypothetical protein